MDQHLEAFSARIRASNDLESKKYFEKIESMELTPEERLKVKQQFEKYLVANNKQGTPITPFNPETNSLLKTIVKDLNLPDIQNELTESERAWFKKNPGATNISKQNQARLQGRFRSR